MGPLSKVQIYFYGLPIEMDNFAFDVKVIQGPESTCLGGGWVAGICKTITNSASAEAGVEARLSLAIPTYFFQPFPSEKNLIG